MSFSGVGSHWLFLRNILLLHFIEIVYGYVAFHALVYFESWCLPHMLFSLELPVILELIEQNFVNSLAIIQISIVLTWVFS